MVGHAFVNRFVVALGRFAHVTANLKHQWDSRNHANSREDKADGTPLPGIQVISDRRPSPAPRSARVPATSISSGIVKTVSFMPLIRAPLGACVYFVDRWEYESFPGSNRRI